MTVCDMCEKEDIKFTKIQIGGALDGYSYVLCKDCTRSQWAGTVVAAANRLEQLGIDFSTIEM